MREYVLTTKDSERWRAVLPASARVLGSVEYARVLERLTGAAARLFVVEWGGATTVYPFMLRPVRAFPSATSLGDRWDTFTPEYSGPVWSGAAPKEDASRRFADVFADHCREQGIVAEFAHLSPWTPADLLDPACVQPNREVIYVDLTWGEEEIWARSLTTDARRQVRQSERAGVRVRHAASLEDIREFHRLYQLTMARRNALDRYHFPLEHFALLFETMRENALFALAEYRGQVVAGGLYFHDATEVVWHLSAVDMEFASVRPVNAYHHDTIRWAVRQGRRRLLCGGAYQPGDGIFRFKANFSPLRAQFQTYRRVHDAAAYSTLTRAWSAHHGGISPSADFFPAYRSAPPGELRAMGPERAEETGATVAPLERLRVASGRATTQSDEQPGRDLHEPGAAVA
jgi:hypothetical protein